MDAHITQHGDTAAVRVGDRAFAVQTPPGWLTGIGAVDFALFGLAAISMSDNIEITLHQPVTASAAESLERLTYTYRSFTLASLAPLRLRLTTVLPDPPVPATGRKILCLSGGIDSTAAAIEAVTRHGYTHALLVAGADYASAAQPGFADLRMRVERNAARLGLQLLVVETGIRALAVDWELTHALCLAMCLHALDGQFDAGGVGADVPEAGDLIQHPWGSGHAVFGLLGTRTLPIDRFNHTLRRPEKLARIVAHEPGLAHELSFCWRDTTIGGNCGACFKCMRTRMNFIAIGADATGLFRDTPDILTYVRALSVPKSFKDLRIALYHLGETHHFLPDGPLKAALGHHVDALREAYVRAMPYR
ncbi:MAG: hypothetical protein RQ752_10655 [Thermohalobaculum sp.]|nr:hypothetical protein [Thermohalobaculum sp.]